MTSLDSVNKKVIFGLFLVHFAGDFYFSFVRPLLPVLADIFTLNLTQVGWISAVSTLTAFFIQPVFGVLADRYQTRLILLTGMLLGAVCVPLVGVVPAYGYVLALIGLGSISSAMYHPTAAGLVSVYGGRHTGLSMSVYGLGGMLGFTIGPVLLASFVTTFGLSRLPFMSVFGVLVSVALLILIPSSGGKGGEEKTSFIDIPKQISRVWKPIVVILVLSVFRGVIEQAMFTFIPVLYAAEGYSLVSVGTLISLFSVGGSVSALIGGYLVDRIGFRPIYYFSFALTSPCTLLFVHGTGVWVYLLAFSSGFMILATVFPSLVLAQKLAPENRALVSSIVMGMAMGIGGVLLPLAGTLADVFGLRPVLSCVAAIPFVLLLLIRYLPEP